MSVAAQQRPRTLTLQRSVSTSNIYRQIYEQHFGNIPKGYHIHHIDGNRDNNNPKNLITLSRKRPSQTIKKCQYYHKEVSLTSYAR